MVSESGSHRCSANFPRITDMLSYYLFIIENVDFTKSMVYMTIKFKLTALV